MSHKQVDIVAGFGEFRETVSVFMKPADFTALPADQQLDTLYYAGNIMANRYEDDHILLLYNLNDFFVELRYDAFTNELQQVTAFRQTALLEPYLPYLPDLA